MSIKLSICIPTYNREKFIGYAIESVIRQIDNNNKDLIEIVISDNASTDNTEALINKYKMENKVQIIYIKHPINMGADNNFIKVIEYANGEYCWYLGSDDALVNGSINIIMKELKEDYDIYLCNRTDCDFNLNPLINKTWLQPEIDELTVCLSNDIELANYFNHSISLGAVFSYISSVIFKKSKWDKIEYDNQITGTAYSHVYMLLSFLNHNSRLKYINKPLVLNRGENDGFFVNHVQRVMLDVNGYLLFSEKFFSDTTLRSDFLKILTREHTMYEINEISIKCNNREWLDIKTKLIEVGYSKDDILLIGKIRKYRFVIKLQRLLIRYVKKIYKGFYFLFYNPKVIINKVKGKITKEKRNESK